MYVLLVTPGVKGLEKGLGSFSKFLRKQPTPVYFQKSSPTDLLKVEAVELEITNLACITDFAPLLPLISIILTFLQYILQTAGKQENKMEETA